MRGWPVYLMSLGWSMKSELIGRVVEIVSTNFSLFKTIVDIITDLKSITVETWWWVLLWSLQWTKVVIFVEVVFAADLVTLIYWEFSSTWAAKIISRSSTVVCLMMVSLWNIWLVILVVAWAHVYTHSKESFIHWWQSRLSLSLGCVWTCSDRVNLLYEISL